MYIYSFPLYSIQCICLVMDIIFYFIEKIYEALSYMALMQHL